MANGQTLFDTLAGGFGHGVDRPGLNAFVANSQAINGLRTAQTDEALTNAQVQQQELEARSKLEDAIAGTLGPDGTPMFNQSQAHLASQAFIAQHGGKVADGIEAFLKMQQAHNTSVISDKNKLNTPEFTAALAGNTNKAPETLPVTENYSVPPGVTPPTVLESPLGAAHAASLNATADLKNHQASAPLAADISDDAAFNAAIKYNLTGQLPSFGMGAAGMGSRKKVLEFAAHASADPNWTPPSWAQGATSTPPGASPTAAPQAGAPGAPGAAPSPTVAHPTLASATNTAVTPLDTKAQGSALADMTKRTAVADSAEQTALKNLDLARTMLAKADQSGSPLANTIQNKIRQGLFGDPDVSAYQNAISTGRNEYARVISMATGAQGITDFAMREGQKLFPDDLAPSQFESNYAVAQQEMANRTGAMHGQIAKLKGGLRGQTPTPTPTPTPAAGGGAAHTFATEEDAAAANLPDGTPVIVGGKPGKWYN